MIITTPSVHAFITPILLLFLLQSRHTVAFAMSPNNFFKSSLLSPLLISPCGLLRKSLLLYVFLLPWPFKGETPWHVYLVFVSTLFKITAYLLLHHHLLLYHHHHYPLLHQFLIPFLSPLCLILCITTIDQIAPTCPIG